MSNSCRKKDSNKTISATFLLGDQSPQLNPLKTNFAPDDFPVRDIVPKRSPTTPITPNRSHSSLCSASLHLSDDEIPPPPKESEATRYLRLFQSPEAQAKAASRKSRPPRHSRSSTSIAALSSDTPSLSHSPTLSDSPSLPFTPFTDRPLPPRTNPYSSSCASRSTDLVNPFATLSLETCATTAPANIVHGYGYGYSFKSVPVLGTSTGIAEGEVFRYEKLVPFVTLETDLVQGRLGEILKGPEGGWGG